MLPSVLASQRRDVILDLVQRQGTVRVRDLARTLDVSEMTVRRDLDVLAGDGLVDKVHGGATRADRPELGRARASRPSSDSRRPRRRPSPAWPPRWSSPGASVGLTAGTTTWTLVTELVQVPALTIVTNAPAVAQVCYHNSRQDQTILLTGGIRTPSDALVGPIATAALSSLHLDLVFMGVHGMDERLGFSTPNLAEAELNRAFVGLDRQPGRGGRPHQVGDLGAGPDRRAGSGLGRGVGRRVGPPGHRGPGRAGGRGDAGSASVTAPSCFVDPVPPPMTGPDRFGPRPPKGDPLTGWHRDPEVVEPATACPSPACP